jgi:hypothetical protein
MRKDTLPTPVPFRAPEAKDRTAESAEQGERFEAGADHRGGVADLAPASRPARRASKASSYPSGGAAQREA